MPVLQSKKDQSAIRRNLLASSSGAVIGLFFGVPPAWGAHTMGLPWAPYGVSVMVIGLIVGLLIAFTVESLIPRTRTSTDQQEHRPLVAEKTAPIKPVNSSVASSTSSARRARLAQEMARLDRLAAERELRNDSRFGKADEERIVWTELLDLELQDIDEQFTHLDKGGLHERNDS